jgi:hypothetical protein
MPGTRVYFDFVTEHGEPFSIDVEESFEETRSLLSAPGALPALTRDGRALGVNPSKICYIESLPDPPSMVVKDPGPVFRVKRNNIV